jgi:heat-inducible transcriptional repressor
VDLVAVNERMASLILVLREGSIKQAVVNLDEADAIDQATLNRVAGLLNERLTDLTSTRADAVLGRLSADDATERLARHVGERIVRILRDYDAATVEEVFSDGLLNVMEAPEFAQSDKLRQIFSALENRAYLGELVGDVAGSGRIRVLIGAENPRAEMHDVSLVLAPYGRPGRAIGVVGVLGPTRMSYAQAIGTVRFVSGLMNELVDHLYA